MLSTSGPPVVVFDNVNEEVVFVSATVSPSASMVADPAPMVASKRGSGVSVTVQTALVGRSLMTSGVATETVRPEMT